MALSENEIRDIAELIARESLFQYFYGKKRISTEHILLKHVFPDDYMVRSSIGGLETSLGTQLWEKLARAIASENGFKVHDPKTAIQQPSNRITSCAQLLELWHEKRLQPKNPIPVRTYLRELDKLLSKEKPKVDSFVNLNKGDGIDLFLSKGGKHYAFDIKTVQWNAGTGTKFNITLMKWLTYYKIQGGSGDLNAHYVIPYDPTPHGWWHSFGSRAYPLDKSDILVADEFWNLISGHTNTLSNVEMGFAKLANSKLMRVYKKCLTEHSIELDLELLELSRNVTRKGSLKDSLSKSKKYDWKCNICKTTFKGTFKNIKDKSAICPICNP